MLGRDGFDERKLNHSIEMRAGIKIDHSSVVASFLAVHNSSIGHLVPWSVTTNNKTLQSDPRDL